MNRAPHLALAAVLCAGIAACDDDPTRPVELLTVTCPAVTDVNAAVPLVFSVPVLPSTISPANIVVSDAATGLEIPGSITLDASGTTATFSANAPFAFSQTVRIRVQNLLSAATNTAIDVTACEFTTQAPPITELFWERLPNSGGTQLVGVTHPSAGIGYTMSVQGILARRIDDGQFEVAFQQPNFLAGFDVDFVTADRGFASFSDFREQRSMLLETTDGAVTFDSVGAAPADNLTRLLFRETGAAAPSDIFGLVGGGSTFVTNFYKYRSASGLTLEQTFTSNGTGQVSDIDVAASDTARAAAVTAGIEVGTIDVRGAVFVSSDGGSSWSEVAGARASDETQTYFGVALQDDGDIFVTGGSGYAARLAPDGAGGYTPTQLLVGAVTNPDPANPLALVYTDVQFSPDDDSMGWIIGAQLVGVVGGVPQYRGLIFATRDGGQTWTRQGVVGAEEYGAGFPKLNRLDVRTSTSAWIVGDGGTVLSFQPEP